SPSTRRFRLRLRDLSHRAQPSSAVTMAACVRLAPLSRRRHAREEQAMRGADKVICQAAAVLLMFSISGAPAKAQFLGGGGAGGVGAPNDGGYTPMGGGYMPTGMGGIGGGDITGMLGGAGGGDMMAMIPQLMRLANVGGGGGHRRHRHR